MENVKYQSVLDMYITEVFLRGTQIRGVMTCKHTHTHTHTQCTVSSFQGLLLLLFVYVVVIFAVKCSLLSRVSGCFGLLRTSEMFFLAP